MTSMTIRNKAWLVEALTYTFMCIKFTKFSQMEMNPYKPLIQALKKFAKISNISLGISNVQI